MSNPATPPPEIEVVFTEGDLQTAGRYTSNYDCILATALKRMGYEKPQIFSYGEARLNGHNYSPGEDEWFMGDDIEFDGIDSSGTPPYYRPEIVGRKLVLQLQASSK